MKKYPVFLGGILGMALEYVIDPALGKDRRSRLVRSNWSPNARVFAMFTGWVIALYGVWRRGSKGTLTTMAGLALTAQALRPVREAPDGTITLRKVA